MGGWVGFERPARSLPVPVRRPCPRMSIQGGDPRRTRGKGFPADDLGKQIVMHAHSAGGAERGERRSKEKA